MDSVFLSFLDEMHFLGLDMGSPGAVSSNVTTILNTCVSALQWDRSAQTDGSIKLGNFMVWSSTPYVEPIVLSVS